MPLLCYLTAVYNCFTTRATGLAVLLYPNALHYVYVHALQSFHIVKVKSEMIFAFLFCFLLNPITLERAAQNHVWSKWSKQAKVALSLSLSLSLSQVFVVKKVKNKCARHRLSMLPLRRLQKNYIQSCTGKDCIISSVGTYSVTVGTDALPKPALHYNQ